MASQLEFSARAALCRELAKREPANGVLWMAEAENWSRLSNEKLRGEPEQNSVTAPWQVCGRVTANDRDVVLIERLGPWSRTILKSQRA